MDRFLIAPFNTGLQQNLRPWLILDDAFTGLNNAYVFRGRVRKRFGSLLMGTLGQLSSRLKINIGTTSGSGGLSGTAPGVFSGSTPVGQMFSIGTEIYTVYQASGPMLDTGATTTKTFNTATGAYVFAGAPASTIVYYYPATPVMGLTVYELGAINNQTSFAFDTQFAYFWSGSDWQRSILGTPPQWHGTDLNFFWTCNWDGITPNVVKLFVTNFNATVPSPAGTDDPLWSYDGTNGWATFTPYFAPAGGGVNTGPFVQTCRLIVPFKDRLVLLNTIENNGSGTNNAYVNRARFCFNGSPFATNAWYEPNQTDSSGNRGAGAGFIDAPTEEQIISAEFIKDRLIVFFQSSTWELAYTGNQQLPFVWQKINTELGAESEFSTIPFDKQIVTIGNVGVHSCNGANVERIDQKIPDEIFEIRDKNSGPSRVCGIRDYYVEMIYWAYPPSNQSAFSATYPNKVLSYNYQNQSWATSDYSFTAFGYFEQQSDITWQTAEFTWNSTNFTWNSGVQQAQFRQIIAGNQQGWVMIIAPDESRNSPSLQITALTIRSSTVPLSVVTLKVINHNMNVGDFVLFETINGIANINGTIGYIFGITDANTISVSVSVSAGITGVYTGGGTLARVSRIDIESKQWNPYDKDGKNVYIQKIDFAVQKTAAGQVTVDYFPSSSDESMLMTAVPDVLTGNGVLETSAYPATLYPFEQFQDRLWHPVYFQALGECIQIRIYLSDAQMYNPLSALSDFELEGLILYTDKIGRLQ